MPGPEKPLKRLERKITVENLWIYILRMLKEKPMYAYELNKGVSDRFGFNIGTASAYVVLYKLKNAGYVKTEWREEGRPRKYYIITESGKEILDKGMDYIRELNKMLE